MKMKNYFKYLMAPLSMVVIYSCSPNQFQQAGEYDDMYFTKADRQTQPQNVDLPPVEDANPSEVDLSYSGKADISPELLERYNAPEDDQITYYEAQGPNGARVTSAKDLNYDDFLYDYENNHLAYYELPMDWNTDWNRSSFDQLMANDYQFRVAWYDQYYQGESWRMDNYLSGRSTNSLSYADFMGPTVGLSLAASDFYSGFGYGVSYGLGMSFVDLNPYGFYDPFWRPIPRWRNSIYVGIGFGSGWNNWYNYNPWRPGWNNGWYGPSYSYHGDNYYSRNRRNVEYGPRLRSSSVASVRSDAINGSGTRTRSMRAVNGSGGSQNTRASVRSGRANTTAINSRSTRNTNSSITANRVNRVRTDDYRIGSRTSGSSGITRNRVAAARQSTARSNYRSTTNGGSSSSRFTRNSINRRSYSSNSNRSSSISSSPSFSRRTSSGMSRSVINRSSRNSSTRSFYNSRNSSYSRSTGNSGRSVNYNRGNNSSSSRRTGSGISRSSSGSSRSSGTSSRGSSSSSRSSSSGSRSSRGNR